MATQLRPQQPADSPIAALPNETLDHILELATERGDPYEGQRTRISFSEVSYGWCAVAAARPTEYAAATTKQAKRLAVSLKASGAAARVRKLVVRVEGEGMGRSSRLLALLKTCRAVEELSLNLVKAIGDNRDAGLGIGGVEALEKLSCIKVFQLCGDARVTRDFAARICKNWPLLESLTLDAPWVHGHSQQPPASLPLVHLRHLDVRADSAPLAIIVDHLKSTSGPTSLIVRRARETYPPSDIAAFLQPLANRLLYFSAPDGWEGHSLANTFLEAMINVCSMEIGYGATAGVGPLGYPGLDLQRLTSLQEISFTEAGDLASIHHFYRHLKLLLASPPPALKRIRIFSALLDWLEHQKTRLDYLNETAEKLGIEFVQFSRETSRAGRNH